MSMKAAVLPSVKTTPEFKKKVEEACESLQLKYSDFILRLLKQWITQKTDLINEPDADFVAGVREALGSEHVQQALQKLGENYIPYRIYQS